MTDEPMPQSEFILYQTEDGRTRIQCRFENETIWLSQARIAELFQKDVRTINEHLVNIFDERELNREATIRKFRMVRQEGTRQVACDELQALQRKAMTMREWIGKLDDFLKLSEHELLDHAGKISATAAKAKAEREYDRYHALVDTQPRRVDADFEKVVKKLKKLPASKKPKARKR